MSSIFFDKCNNTMKFVSVHVFTFFFFITTVPGRQCFYLCDFTVILLHNNLKENYFLDHVDRRAHKELLFT